MKHYRTVTCQEVTCGVRFTASSANTKYCPECKREVGRDQTIDSLRKMRGSKPKLIKEKPEEHWLSRWKRDRNMQ
jgi:hypothetical protein